MNIRKILSVTGAIAILAIPATSLAATDQDAIEACARAMTDEVDMLADPDLRITVASDPDNGARRLRGTTLFHLDAMDAASRQVVARVDCIVNQSGAVRSIRTIALDSLEARKRAKAVSAYSGF